MVRTRARGRGNIQYKSRQGRRIGEMEGHCQERHEGMEDARGLDQYRTRYPTQADGAENRTERRTKKKLTCRWCVLSQHQCRNRTSDHLEVVSYERRSRRGSFA